MISIKERYALTDEGARTLKIATVWVALTNLCVMVGMAFLFLAMQAFIDSLVNGAPLPNPWPWCAGLLAYAAVLFVCNRMQYAYTYGRVYRESGRQRVALAERLRQLPLAFFGRRDLADLTETIMTDATSMEHVWSHILPELYGAAISTAVVAVGLVAFNPLLALASLWTVPVAFALIAVSNRALRNRQAANRARSVEVSDRIQEMLECVREIRATGRERATLEQFGAAVDDFERNTFLTEFLGGVFMQGAQGVMRLGIASTVLAAAGMLAAGTLDFMEMFAFLLVVSRVYAPFDQCLMMVFELSFVRNVAGKRIQSFYSEPLAGGSKDFAPANHDIAFESVGFSYGARGEKVFEDVSFTAKEGQVTALVGPSGGGKSTCAKLAARLWDADAGTVRVGGVDVSTVDPETLLRDFSMVFQDVLLFDDTVMNNIRLGRQDATDEEVLRAARAANCDEFVLKLPRGYETAIGENGSRLSGGERQRISIARAILKDAPIVLLDEATASLDVENESQVQAALARLLAGKTVLVIAHRMRTVMNAHKIVVLADGRVAEQGSPTELLEKGGVFRRMVELQQQAANWAL